VRIKLDFKQTKKIPMLFKKYFWDCPTGSAPLEKILVRVLSYGKFEEIRKLFVLYPEQVYKVVNKYPELARGVRFWIKTWHAKR